MRRITLLVLLVGSAQAASVPTGRPVVTDGSALPVKATGSTTTLPLADWMAQTVNVKAFGAKGDGSDDTAKIQAAIDAASPGQPVYFPAATYKVATSISSTTGKDLHLIFAEGAVLDGSSSTAATLVTLGGTVGSGIALGADVSRGATSISVPGHTFVAGDIIRIQSTDIWNPTRAYYYKGEIARVQAVSGDTVYVDTALYDSYTAATTSAYRYSGGRVRIDGLRMIRASNQAGLTVQYAHDVVLNGVDVRGANERDIYLLECFNVGLVNCNTYGTYYTGAGTAYGLVMGSCQHVKVSEGYFVGGRHGIAIGGTFPNRDLKFFGVDIDNDGASGINAFDAHGNVEFMDVVSCHVHNAAALQAINLRVIGGEYRSSSYASAALWLIPEVSGAYLEISNVLAQNFDGGTGVAVSLYADGLTFDRVSVVGATVRSTVATAGTRAAHIAVDVVSGGWSGTIGRLTLRDNDVVFPSAPTGTTYACSVGAVGALTADVLLDGNSCVAGFNHGRALYLKVTGSVLSRGNKYLGADSANYHSVIAGGDFTSQNDTWDGGGSAAYVSVTTSGKVKLLGGAVTGLASNGGFYVTTATDVQIRDPVSSVPGVPLISATHAYSTASNLGQKTMYRTAAPTLGTWGVGDRTVNSAPAVGQPKGWTCTVAGSPGTWVSEGNL